MANNRQIAKLKKKKKWTGLKNILYYSKSKGGTRAQNNAWLRASLTDISENIFYNNKNGTSTELLKLKWTQKYYNSIEIMLKPDAPTHQLSVNEEGKRLSDIRTKSFIPHYKLGHFLTS